MFASIQFLGSSTQFRPSPETPTDPARAHSTLHVFRRLSLEPQVMPRGSLNWPKRHTNANVTASNVQHRRYPRPKVSSDGSLQSTGQMNTEPRFAVIPFDDLKESRKSRAFVRGKPDIAIRSWRVFSHHGRHAATSSRIGFHVVAIEEDVDQSRDTISSFGTITLSKMDSPDHIACQSFGVLF